MSQPHFGHLRRAGHLAGRARGHRHRLGRAPAIYWSREFRTLAVRPELRSDLALLDDLRIRTGRARELAGCELTYALVTRTGGALGRKLRRDERFVSFAGCDHPTSVTLMPVNRVG